MFRRSFGLLLLAVGCHESEPPKTSDSTSTTTNTDGKMDPQVVNGVIHARDRELRACYSAGLRRNPQLGAGEVKIRFTVDDRGRAVAVEDAGSRLKDKQVVACMIKEFGELRFPPPEVGTPTMVYPMIFGAGDAHP